ncbi:hypothetical protein FRB96_006331 [Tulasnella sp. 330]|nr:hypothetical protein FRB96_006331 [Tulasnella sp. 330]
MSQPQTPSASTSVPNFRLPSQPTILLKAPSEETVVRLRQLAPYYWSHPQTTNCSIHFPIDVRTQQRIQSYQVRQQRQQAANPHAPTGRATRSGSINGGSSNDGSSRRTSLTPAAAVSGTPGRSPSVSRQGSTARLRAVYSGRDLAGSSARAAILGNSDSPHPTSPSPIGDGSFPRRGSLTPGYDPFSTAKTSIVVTSAAAQPAGIAETRRESLAGGKLVAGPDMGRRGSVTVVGANGMPAQMKSVRLHVEYLTAQSALIRQVLAQAAGYQPVLDQRPISTPSTPPHTARGPPTPATTPPLEHPPLSSPAPTVSSSSSAPANPFPHSFFRFSPHRYPRVIQPPSNPAPSTSSNTTHVGPTIILPVPDPASFPILIHYMYHGSMDPIERSLKDGSVTWEGLVRNVEYLGLREEVKRYLGKWWKSWREREGVEGGTNKVDDDDDEDEAKGGYPYGNMKMDMDDESGWSSPSSTGGGTSSLDDEMAGLLGRF